MNHKPWRSIFDAYNIEEHDFSTSPFIITSGQIKRATSHFKITAEKEVRLLCKHDSREDRPNVFVEKGLFMLPVKNGTYAILKGEGYVDIPEITTPAQIYTSKLTFDLETSRVGNSEMQHLDFAYASSLIRTFAEDSSLVMTIRGRKFTPAFDFNVGTQLLSTKGVQTEVDAGYEGREQLALIEAKNSSSKNTIIRQLYYPFRQWQQYTKKKVNILFFEKRRLEYLLWEFTFKDVMDYNSIELVRSAKFIIEK
jgi:hypothetical protein